MHFVERDTAGVERVDGGREERGVDCVGGDGWC